LGDSSGLGYDLIGGPVSDFGEGGKNLGYIPTYGVPGYGGGNVMMGPQLDDSASIYDSKYSPSRGAQGN